MQWITIRKGLYCALRPSLWRHLRHGVAPAIEHEAALSRFQFETIVDVGANRGQFATIARRLFPTARIYSFEPLSAPARIFQKLFSGDENTVLFNAAIGPEKKDATIHVTGRDDSSSILRPGAMQGEVFGVAVVGTETISVGRLTHWLSTGEISTPALLKIDVQGGELDVLEGSSELMERFQAVYVECSYLQMYEGQPLIGDIVDRMKTLGFELRGVFNQYVDRRYGAVQADVLFTACARRG